jgi:HK97 family phage major capsid protein
MTDITLSPREQREYRLGEALMEFQKDNESQRSGLAWEVSAELRKNLAPGQLNHGGLLVPYDLPVELRAGLDTATATKGQELKFTGKRTFVDVLRRRSIVIRGGATVLTGLVGDINDPQATASGTAAWTTQNPGADVADSSATFGAVPLIPKEILSTTSYSRQLLAQSTASASVDEIVRRDLAKIHGVAIDAAALAGTGAGGQPTGLINRPGMPNNPFGANGLLPSWALVTSFERKVAVADGDQDDYSPQVYITSPEVRDRFRITDRTAGTSGWMIMDGDSDGINGHDVFATNQLPKNTVKGTSGAVCHTIIYGSMSEFFIGFWGAFEILADPFRLKKQGMVELTSYQLADVNVRHLGSFQVATDVLP